MALKITEFDQEDIYNGTDSFRIVGQYTSICQPIFSFISFPDPFSKVDGYYTNTLGSIDDNFVVSRGINKKIKINFQLPKKFNSMEYLEKYGLPFVLTIPKTEDVKFLVNGKPYNEKVICQKF